MIHLSIFARVAVLLSSLIDTRSVLRSRRAEEIGS